MRLTASHISFLTAVRSVSRLCYREPYECSFEIEVHRIQSFDHSKLSSRMSKIPFETHQHIMFDLFRKSLLLRHAMLEEFGRRFCEIP